MNTVARRIVVLVAGVIQSPRGRLRLSEDHLTFAFRERELAVLVDVVAVVVDPVAGFLGVRVIRPFVSSQSVASAT
jgi:hypothetical protein